MSWPKAAFIALAVAIVLLPRPCWGESEQETRDVVDLDLEELLQVRVTSPSGVEETLLNAPTSMIVITAADIERRGYTSIADVLYDLPGFDLSLVNGTTYLLAYQRGYRTPWTQRTLVMVDGKVDNSLWTHAAELSRQYPLSNVKQIEVLYGPVSAVYGSNAFLGIINIITRNGREEGTANTSASGHFEFGAFSTYGADVGFRARYKDLAIAVSGRLFRSDEPDLSDRWGYLSNELMSDEEIWGPMLDLEHQGVAFGEYHDPTDDYGIVARVSLRNLTVGYLDWRVREGYGPYYAADRAQNNSFWNKSSRRIHAEYVADLHPRLKSTTCVQYRQSRRYGSWVEAVPDTEPGMEDYSWISYTDWNAIGDSWLLRENLEWRISDAIMLLGGGKWERKDLTKAYDIPGYWGVYSTTDPSDDPGPHGYGTGVGHSTDETYARPSPPLAQMPADNRVLTHDLGTFLLGIAEVKQFRFNAGLRIDYNSLFGHSVNPRLSALAKINDRGAIKLFYGEAFQEPAPVQLWGGWSGRAANPDLDVEKVRTVELLGLYQFRRVFGSVSGYYSHFNDVIMEDALNLGTRDVVGAEATLRFTIPNPIPESADFSGYANYTFNYVRSSMTYDHDLGEWVEGATALGDIAPHKLNVGLNFPIWRYFNLNVRGNYVSRRELYSANPLRGAGKALAPYFRLNMTFLARVGPLRVTVTVINLLDSDYYHPGPERADAGDDFDNRSLGFMNSAIPQPGRHVMLKLGGDI